MEYLNSNGFDFYNVTNEDIGIIKIPFTVDNYGQPVSYIIDLLNDKIRNELNLYLLKPNTKELFENHMNKLFEKIPKKIDRIRHEVYSVKNNIIKISTDKNNSPVNTELFHYAACYPTDNGEQIYGLGVTPESAFNDAIKSIEAEFYSVAKINMEPQLEKFELFFQLGLYPQGQKIH